MCRVSYGDGLKPFRVSPLRGLRIFFDLSSGAHAPGYGSAAASRLMMHDRRRRLLDRCWPLGTGGQVLAKGRHEGRPHTRFPIDSSTPPSTPLGMTSSSRYRPFVPTERAERRFMLSSRPRERSERVEGSMDRIRVGGGGWQSRCDSRETATGNSSGSDS